MYSIILKQSARKELDALPKKVRSSLAQALDELAMLGTRARHTKMLHDPLIGYRMRVGNYRILFDLKDTFILVHRIKKRAEAYR